MLEPDFVSRAYGATIYVISITLALVMLYVIFELFVLLDPFDFFPDTRAPSKITDYTSEQIRWARWYHPNSPQYRNCSTGMMVGGVAEEYIWGAALGVLGGGGPSTEDILFAAGMACFNGGGGPSSSRKLWTLTRENTSEVLQHSRFGRFYQHRSTGLYWTKDLAGHGGSVWKVYRIEGRQMVHQFDADEFGDALNKHKGPVGQSIPLGEFSRVQWIAP